MCQMWVLNLCLSTPVFPTIFIGFSLRFYEQGFAFSTKKSIFTHLHPMNSPLQHASPKATILLADENEIYLTGLTRTVRKISCIQKICIAQNASEINALLENLAINIIIIDIQFLKSDRESLCCTLRKNYPHIKVIALGNIRDSLMFLSLMKDCGKGFLLKNTTKAEIELALEIVLEGKSYFARPVQDAMNIRAYKESLISKKDHAFLKSERIRELLALLCNEMTTKEIASRLCITEKTVEKYRKDLMRATGARNVVGLVLYAIQNEIVDEATLAQKYS